MFCRSCRHYLTVSLLYLILLGGLHFPMSLSCKVFFFCFVLFCFQMAHLCLDYLCLTGRCCFYYLYVCTRHTCTTVRLHVHRHSRHTCNTPPHIQTSPNVPSSHSIFSLPACQHGCFIARGCDKRGNKKSD